MVRFPHRLMMIVLVMVSSSLHTSDYNEPEDFAIVNAIRKISDLSKADVDRWKLLQLGGFQDVAAAGVGAAAIYKGGTTTYDLLGKLGEYGPTDSNKFWWALAGAVGAGVGAYKVLNPRLAGTMLSKIKVYVAMCSKFIVATSKNVNWEALGTTMGNAMWARSSNIVRAHGIKELIDQAEFALLLLEELGSSETSQLMTQVGNFKQNLMYNYAVIMPFAEGELAKRIQSRGVNVQGAHQLAQLALTQQQTSAIKVGTISLGLTAARNFFQKTMESAVYIYENKEKIAGGVVSLIFLPYLIQKAWTVQKKLYE
jgi:hypothetical protein